MNDRVVIYRTSDRPKYVERTLPHLYEQTNPETQILIIENSEKEESIRDTEVVIDKIYDTYRVVHESQNKRLGGTGAIQTGLQIVTWRGDISKAFVVDDDVMVPMMTHGAGYMHYWDDILAVMLEQWQVVAHPWTRDFRNPEELEQRAGVEGYTTRSVGGGCSAFNIEFEDRFPMKQQTLIHGYGSWIEAVGKAGQAAYSSDFDMVIQHIDRPEHPWSLRDTEYDEYSTEMYYQRWPQRRGQERPKGAAGIW